MDIRKKKKSMNYLSTNKRERIQKEKRKEKKRKEKKKEKRKKKGEKLLKILNHFIHSHLETLRIRVLTRQMQWCVSQICLL